MSKSEVKLIEAWMLQIAERMARVAIRSGR